MSAKQKTFSLGMVILLGAFIYVQYENEIQVDESAIVSIAKTVPKLSTLLRDTGATLMAKAVVAFPPKKDTCNIHVKRFDCNVKQSVAVVAVNEKVIANTREVQDAWLVGNEKSPIPSIVLNEKIVAYEVVEINQQPESIPQVGEKITLPMLKGQKVVVDVQAISTNANGDQSWSGHLEGQGTDYPVIMTYGEHSAFAMITTPEGSYSMESVDGIGWVYKNPSEHELSKPGTNDFLEVNEIL